MIKRGHVSCPDRTRPQGRAMNKHRKGRKGSGEPKEEEKKISEGLAVGLVLVPYCYYNKTPVSGQILKHRSLFSSSFWRLCSPRA